MKRIITILAVIAATALCFSCKKAEPTSVNEVKVQVNLPGGFIGAYEGEVILNDRNTDISFKSNAVGGVATFKDVPFGVYDASASWTVNAAKFKELAGIFAGDIASDVSFNGNKTVITIAKEDDVVEPIRIDLTWSVASKLVFSKLYDFGTLNNAGKAYNYDKYFEIFNNSAELQYADGLLLGEAYGSAVSASGYPDVATADYTYLQKVVRLPGSGKDFPIKPGESVVLALNAQNHIDPEVVTLTVDLSKAEFECYVEGASSMFITEDHKDVPNVIDLFGAGTYQAKFGVTQGAVVVLFQMTDAELDALEKVLVPGSDAYGAAYASYCKALPNAKVMDAVDCKRTGYEDRGGKHVPNCVDAGFAMFNQRAITERKISFFAPDGRIVLQDTNNSTNDFVQIVAGTDEPKWQDPSLLLPKDYTKAAIQPLGK